MNDVETETGTSAMGRDVATVLFYLDGWTVQSEAHGPLLRLATYVRTTKAQLLEPMLNTITIPMFKNEHIVSTRAVWYQYQIYQMLYQMDLVWYQIPNALFSLRYHWYQYQFVPAQPDNIGTNTKWSQKHLVPYQMVPDAFGTKWYKWYQIAHALI